MKVAGQKPVLTRRKSKRVVLIAVGLGIAQAWIDFGDGILGGDGSIASARDRRISRLPDKCRSTVASIGVTPGLKMLIVVGVVKVDEKCLRRRLTCIQSGCPEQVFPYTVGRVDEVVSGHLTVAMEG